MAQKTSLNCSLQDLLLLKFASGGGGFSQPPEVLLFPLFVIEN